MEWEQKTPTVEGFYLRYNIRYQLHFLKDMHAEFDNYPKGLYLSFGERGLVNVETLSKDFWWYGPIPETQGIAREK